MAVLPPTKVTDRIMRQHLAEMARDFATGLRDQAQFASQDEQRDDLLRLAGEWDKQAAHLVRNPDPEVVPGS